MSKTESYKDLAKSVSNFLGFKLIDGETGEIYVKKYEKTEIRIDFDNEKIIYPKEIILGRHTIDNFKKPENFVVLECVDSLITKGYPSEKLELEYNINGKLLDILVKNLSDDNAYMMIECKTYGTKFTNEKKNFLNNDNSANHPNQLFSYFYNDKGAKILCLYASRFTSKGELQRQQAIVFTKDLDKEGNNATELFNKWDKNIKETGVFEASVPVYPKEGVLKSGQLQPLDAQKSSGIFNDFLQILRNNGISDKPNAFNKILNLFICKIVDELKERGKDLEFYWDDSKPAEYSYARLEKLYKNGMEQFLNTEITDFDVDKICAEINNIQGVGSNIADEVREALTKTKCHKSSEFAFKEVYNEETFNDNAKTLKKIVELLEPYQFRYGHKQQFLSIFFENLLATSIKQEVGQFFTPVPLAQFMVTSLPLKEKLDEKIKNACEKEWIQPNASNIFPTVVDYACGSGHFLTEFMDIQQTIIDNYDTSTIKKTTVKRKVENMQSIDDEENDNKFVWADECVYGIEKDHRLVKTTKISTFLNGDGAANIIRADGLEAFGNGPFGDPRFPLLNKPGQFDYVITNPPFSVDDFVQDLSNHDFSAFKNNLVTDSSDDIECLFVERTKQILREGGLAAVILPKSMLTNDKIHADARQNLIKYFHIRAIVKMGQNTFMCTRIETVILFLERRPDEDCEKAKAVVKNFLETHKDYHYNNIKNVFSKYAEINDLSFDDYISILSNSPTETAKKSDYYIIRQENSKKNKFLEDEQERLINFLLVVGDKCIIADTGEKDEEKTFLGYEFSNRRGYEGIHNYGESSMLYDRDNVLNDDPKKLNYLIRQSFLKKDPVVPECLKKNVRALPVEDLFEFARGNQIFLKQKKKFSPSLYPVERIDCIEKISISKGSSITKKETKKGSIPVVAGGKKPAYYSNKSNRDGEVITVSASGNNSGYVNYWNEPIFASDCTTIQSDNPQILSKYIAEYLERNQDVIYSYKTGLCVKHISEKDVRSFKLPLCPLDVQTKIVKECSVIEEDTLQAVKQKKVYEAEIDKLFKDLDGEFVSLGDKSRFEIGGGKRLPVGENFSFSKTDYPYIRVTDFGKNTITTDNIKYISDKLHRNLVSNKVSSKTDICISIAGTIGLINLVPSELDQANFTENMAYIRVVDLNKINPRIVAHIMRSEEIQTKIKSMVSNSNQPKLSLEKIKSLSLNLPNIEIQNKIASQLVLLEEKIEELTKLIESERQRKDAVIDKYLQ